MPSEDVNPTIDPLQSTLNADSALSTTGDSQPPRGGKLPSLTAHEEARYQLMAAIRRHLEIDGPVTLGYRLAINNRLTENDLGPRRLEITKYTPVFVHDVLMLPGSLAQLLGKQSEADLIPRITPAYISGYRKIVDPGDGEATMLSVRGSDIQAHGMIVFGQGEKRRAMIEEHYSSSAVKTTVEAVIEIAAAIPRADRIDPHVRFRYQSKTLAVDAFVPSVQQQASMSTTILRDWTLASFLRGEYMY